MINIRLESISSFLNEMRRQIRFVLLYYVGNPKAWKYVCVAVLTYGLGRGDPFRACVTLFTVSKGG